MNSSRRVVLVDGRSETETVLSAVLGPRGLQVDRIRGHQLPRHSAHAGETVPDVVVVDLDEATPAVTAAWPDQPRIFIGSMAIADGTPNAASRKSPHLAKPFHYAELIQTLEDLLDQPRAA